MSMGGSSSVCEPFVSSGWVERPSLESELPDFSTCGRAFSFSLSCVVVPSAEETVPGMSAGSWWTIYSTRPRRTETMMAASRVSRKTMKKMGTEKTFLPMAC